MRSLERSLRGSEGQGSGGARVGPHPCSDFGHSEQSGPRTWCWGQPRLSGRCGFLTPRQSLFSMSPPALTLSPALHPLFQGLWSGCRSPSSSADEKVWEGSWPCSLAGLVLCQLVSWETPPFAILSLASCSQGAAARLGLASGAVGGQVPGQVPQRRDVVQTLAWQPRPGPWCP